MKKNILGALIIFFVVSALFVGITHTAYADGELDTTFDPGGGADNRVFAITAQTDDKIIIGGDFLNYDGVARTRVARLNSDGSLDTTFNPGTGPSGSVRIVLAQSDGKIIIGGLFTSYNGTSAGRITRVNADGSLIVKLKFISPDGTTDIIVE